MLPESNMPFKVYAVAAGVFRSKLHFLPPRPGATFLLGNRPRSVCLLLTCGAETFCRGVAMKGILSNPKFWNTKIKIAILTLATFIAMC